MIKEKSVHVHVARYPTDLCLLKALDIADELRSFLQHKFLYWLEVHSCMQTQRDGPGAMLPLFLEWTMVSRTEYKCMDERLILFSVRRR